MSTLFVSDTTDYSSMSLADVTAVNFVNTFPASATATFDISQFDGVQIDFSVTFSGSTGFNGVTIKEAKSPSPILISRTGAPLTGSRRRAPPRAISFSARS